MVRRVVVLLICLAGLHVLLAVVDYPAHGLVPNDYAAFHVAGAAVRSGVDYYVGEPGRFGLSFKVPPSSPWQDLATRVGATDANRFVYPPVVAAAWVPISFLPPLVGYALFTLASVAALGYSAFALTGGPGLPDRSVAPWLLLLLLVASPTRLTLMFGQWGLLFLAAFVASLRDLQKGRDVRAGVWLGLAATVKIWPLGFAAWLLAIRRRKAAAAVVGSTLAAVLLTLPIVGLDAWRRFASGPMAELARGTPNTANQSILGALGRTLYVAGTFDGERTVALARTLAGVVGAALVAALGFVILKRRSEGPERIPLEMAACVVVALVAVPVSWEHGYVTAVIAVAALLPFRAHPWVLAAGTALCLVQPFYPLPDWLVQLPMGASYHLIGGLVLLGAIGSAVLGGGEAADVPSRA